MNTINKRKHKKLRKPVKLVISLLVLVCVSVGGTVAYLTSKGSVTNQFTVAKVDTEVIEKFDGTEKKNVTATNKGDVPAFIRIKLVTYRVNGNGDHIGGTATISKFTPGTDWFKSGDCYYYSKPVQPGQQPVFDLIGDSGITLETYHDADGGKQVIEVIAEAIQATPAQAISDAWGNYVDVHVNTTTGEPESISAKS